MTLMKLHALIVTWRAEHPRAFPVRVYVSTDVQADIVERLPWLCGAAGGGPFMADMLSAHEFYMDPDMPPQTVRMEAGHP